MRYPPVGRCIYCGATRYDRVKRKLAEEHIVPLAANGNLILPEASCRPCERSTWKAEDSVLGISGKAYRTQLGYKSRRKRPTTLILQNVNNTGRSARIPVDLYPPIFALMIWPLPRLLSGRSVHTQSGELWFDLDTAAQTRTALAKIGIYSWDGPDIHNEMVFRMVAKIAHSYLAAEIGHNQFRPLLTNYILHQSGDIHVLIGGTEKPETPTTSAHRLAHWQQCIQSTTYHIVSVQLFANRMGPTFLAITGEAQSTLVE